MGLVPANLVMTHGVCLRMRCGYFRDLINLDVGIGEGGSICESGERISSFIWRMASIYYAVW